MSRAWRAAARPSLELQRKPRSPALVRALLTRQPTAACRARPPERRRAPGHAWTAVTTCGSEIVGADGTVGAGGTGSGGSGVWAAAVAGPANSNVRAAPSAARVLAVPLQAGSSIATSPRSSCKAALLARVPGPWVPEGSPASSVVLLHPAIAEWLASTDGECRR